MAIYVQLQEDEYQSRKHNVSSSFRQTISDISKTKKYSILLALVLLINTVIIIIVAYNKTTHKINELSIKNESNFYEYQSSDLSYDEQFLSDYSSNVTDDQLRIEFDDLTTEMNYIDNEQNEYISSEIADKVETITDDNDEFEAGD